MKTKKPKTTTAETSTDKAPKVLTHREAKAAAKVLGTTYEDIRKAEAKRFARLRLIEEHTKILADNGSNRGTFLNTPEELRNAGIINAEQCVELLETGYPKRIDKLCPTCGK